MARAQKRPKMIKLTEQQEKEGYRVEQNGSNVLVWHHNTQIALLCSSADIGRKMQEVVERRSEELKEVEEKTGWKPS